MAKTGKKPEKVDQSKIPPMGFGESELDPAALRKENELLKQRLSETFRMKSDLEESLKAEQEKVRKIEESLKEANRQKSNYSIVAQKRQEQIDDLTFKINQKDSTINDLQHRNNEMLKKLNNATDSVEELDNKIEALEEAVSIYRRDLYSLNTTNQKLTRDLEKSQSRFLNLSFTIMLALALMAAAAGYHKSKYHNHERQQLESRTQH